MPVKTCLSSLLSTRFEFGVPLEDVFPPNDIHPRLKYLFGKAYESYVKHGYNIEIILRQEQGSMKERLNLKEKLVLNLDYHINVEDFYPGSYFWVLRHFLGLLPLPLLPKYTKGIQFDWGNLADDCKLFLQNYGTQQKDKHVLDYEIAQILNMLPFENFVLLNAVLVFLRRLSTKNVGSRPKFNRKPMLILSKYFCSSIFIRPYRPGYHPMNDSHLPLLLYLILRWQKISSHCESIGHPAFFLECDIRNLETYNSLGQKDSCTQTNILGNAFFNPEVISVCRNIPYFVNVCNNYLRDIGCQTDTNLCREKNDASYCAILEESGEESAANLNDEENMGNNVTENGKNGNDTDYKLAYIEEELDNVSAKDDEADENTFYQTATDFSFNNVNNKRQDWQNIVNETLKTVKRIEESYIYDDYETFKKEDFNQIGKNRSRSFLSKISKHGFTYTPSNKLTLQEAGITSTPKKESSDSDTSYVKYPDVCENVDLTDHRIDQCNTEAKFNHGIMKSTKSVSQKLFQDDSPMDIQADNSKQDLQNDDSKKKKKKYIYKRIRLSLEFLRALTPKKSTFKIIESRVKYHRMKNAKPYTI